MVVPEATAPVPAALELILHVTAVLGLLTPETVALNCNTAPAVIV